MDPKLLDRQRRYTLNESISVFRKKFLVNDGDRIVKNEGEEGPQVTRNFESFGLPDWQLPYDYKKTLNLESPKEGSPGSGKTWKRVTKNIIEEEDTRK